MLTAHENERASLHTGMARIVHTRLSDRTGAYLPTVPEPGTIVRCGLNSTIGGTNRGQGRDVEGHGRAEPPAPHPQMVRVRWQRSWIGSLLKCVEMLVMCPLRHDPAE